MVPAEVAGVVECTTEVLSLVSPKYPRCPTSGPVGFQSFFLFGDVGERLLSLLGVVVLLGEISFEDDEVHVVDSLDALCFPVILHFVFAPSPDDTGGDSPPPDDTGGEL